MSLKGKVFTVDDLPGPTQDRMRKGLLSQQDQANINQWLRSQTERFRIVAFDGDTPLIAEELSERIVRQMSPNARQIATELLRLSPGERLEVLQAFTADGDLISIFREA